MAYCNVVPRVLSLLRSRERTLGTRLGMLAQSECTRKLSIQGLYPSVVSALQIKRSKNYFRYVTSVFLKFTFYMLTFILQYSYFFRSESFQEVLQTSKQRNIIFREMCSEIGRFLLQVTGCRLQVTGHRSQVTGCRSYQNQKAISNTGDTRVTRDSQEVS